jgi:hypothetical protein
MLLSRSRLPFAVFFFFTVGLTASAVTEPRTVNPAEKPVTENTSPEPSPPEADPAAVTYMEVLPYSASHIQLAVLGRSAESVDLEVETEEGIRVLHTGMPLNGKATIVLPYVQGGTYRIVTPDDILLATAPALSPPGVREWSKIALVLVLIIGALVFFRRRRSLTA